MNKQERRDRVGNRIGGIAVFVFAVILAYLFWPVDPFASAISKASTIMALVLVGSAIGLAALIW